MTSASTAPATMPHHCGMDSGSALSPNDRESAEEDDDRFERRARSTRATRQRRGCGPRPRCFGHADRVTRSTPPSSPRRRRALTRLSGEDDGAREHDRTTIGCRSPRPRGLGGVGHVAVHRHGQAVRFGQIRDPVGVVRRARSPAAVANTCAASGASCATMPAASLSASTPSTTTPLVEVEGLAQRRGESPSAVRVVGGIHEHRRVRRLPAAVGRASSPARVLRP